MKPLLVLILTTLLSANLLAETLDQLFLDLKSTDSLTEASLIEEKIWGQWMTGPSEEDTEAMVKVVVAMQQGELSFALVLLDELVESSPEFAEAWNKRATIHYMLGNFYQSFLDVERTLILEPRHFGAWSGMGLMLEQIGRMEAAIKAHETVLGIYPASDFTALKLQQLKAEQLKDSI